MPQGIHRDIHIGDPVLVNWEMLSEVPAQVLTVYSNGWLNVGIKPQTLEELNVERGGYFRIHPRTLLVHLVVKPGEFTLNRTIYSHGISVL